MHECPDCGQTCDCDGDVWENDWAGRTCRHACDDAERLVDGDTARMRDIKQAAVDACQSVQNEIEAGATFANIPLAIASRMALAWLDIERRQGEVEIRADRAQALFRQIRRWIESGEDCTNRIYESVGKELDY